MSSVSNVAPSFQQESLVFNEIQSKDLPLNIFSYLNLVTLETKCFFVSKSWRDLTRDPVLLKRVVYEENSFTFNSKDWKKYFGKEVEKAKEYDSLPLNIYEILKRPCPVFPEKTIRETHIPVWVPEMVEGEFLTLKVFGKILKSLFSSRDANYGYYGFSLSKILEDHGDQKVGKSHWVLMFNGVLPDSENRSYEDQEAMVALLDEEQPYGVPETLEAVICISAQHFKFKNTAFTDDPWLCTRCPEKSLDCYIIVGGLSPFGLVINTHEDNEAVSVSASKCFT